MTGCSGTATEENKGGDTAQNTSGAYPITIKHAYGETVIESEPKNVATIAWGNHDVPLALGTVPVGVSKANYGKSDENGLLPWTAEKYKELGVEKPVVYDDIGNIISFNSNNYVYNSRNLMSSVSLNNGKKINYFYNC